MEFISKLESTVGGWVKNVPHLPVAGQKWLATNVWWIVLIGVILSALGVIFALVALFGLIALLAAVGNATYGYYAAAGVTGLTILAAVVGLVFIAIRVLILAIAVKPLKDLQKKGWVLLFVAWLIHALSVVLSAILSFSVTGFLLGIIFGAIGLAISGYFIFEIRGQFAQASKPVAAKKA